MIGTNSFDVKRSLAKLRSLFRTCDGEDRGSSYFQALAQKLKEEYINKPVQSILDEVQKLMKVKATRNKITLCFFYSKM